MSRVEGSPAYPSYPGRATFSYISLQNLANRLHEEQKVGSARRVTRLAGSPFYDGRVTLLAGSTFLHINTLARLAGSPFYDGRVTLLAGSTFLHINPLARLAGSTPSRRDNQSMRELCCHWECASSMPPTSTPTKSNYMKRYINHLAFRVIKSCHNKRLYLRFV